MVVFILILCVFPPCSSLDWNARPRSRAKVVEDYILSANFDAGAAPPQIGGKSASAGTASLSLIRRFLLRQGGGARHGQEDGKPGGLPARVPDGRGAHRARTVPRHEGQGPGCAASPSPAPCVRHLSPGLLRHGLHKLPHRHLHYAGGSGAKATTPFPSRPHRLKPPDFSRRL